MFIVRACSPRHDVFNVLGTATWLANSMLYSYVFQARFVEPFFVIECLFFL